MIKCVECGKVVADGGPRYATLIGSFCCDCWDKKDQKYKDGMLKRALYGLRFMAGAISDMKKGDKR